MPCSLFKSLLTSDLCAESTTRTETVQPAQRKQEKKKTYLTLQYPKFRSPVWTIPSLNNISYRMSFMKLKDPYSAAKLLTGGSEKSSLPQTYRK